MSSFTSRRGSYGVDAPYVLIGFGIGALALLAVAINNIMTGSATGALGPAIGAFCFLLFATSFLYTTRRGKFRVWTEIIDDLELRPECRLLDIGCGRGAVLLLAAQRLGPGGKAHGIDLWRSLDQTGNALTATEKNTIAEGVDGRIELHTGDMTALPFSDGYFDLVLSSLAIHNLKTETGRLQAVSEAIRVLRPGGRLAFADIRHADTYAKWIRKAGATDVCCRTLGWRFWYGGPWVAARLVTATKPTGQDGSEGRGIVS